MKKESKLPAVQTDKSTYVSNKDIILRYIRFIDYDCNDIKEELQCCVEMPFRTTSFEIMILINEYLDRKPLGWQHCVGVCPEGR
jgi:hypothetical protein